MFKLAKNAISISTIIFKVFLKKNFELFSHHCIFGFRIMLLLILLLNYCFAKKQGGKKDLILFISLAILKWFLHCWWKQ